MSSRQILSLVATDSDWLDLAAALEAMKRTDQRLHKVETESEKLPETLASHFKSLSALIVELQNETVELRLEVSMLRAEVHRRSSSRKKRGRAATGRRGS
jgi:uncharacterized protein YhaN